MKNKWSIRRYKNGDELQICSLFEKNFKRPMGKTESIKHWEWEFKHNPCKSLEIYLAEDNGKIVGQYAVIPVKMKIKEKDLLATLSLDTITDENYRGQGMFPILAKKLYSELGIKGIPITYGFPNKNSIRGFINKLEWIDIIPFLLLVRPIKFKSLIKKVTNNALFSYFFGKIGDILWKLRFIFKPVGDKSIIIRKIKKFDSIFDKLWQETRNEYNICVVRDQTYLNWRYVDKPEETYDIFVAEKGVNLLGYIVLKCEEKLDLKTGFIMDMLVLSSQYKAISTLISEAINYFKDKKVDVISSLMLKDNQYHKIYKKFGFIKVPSLLFPQEIYFGVRRNTNELSNGFISNTENWFISWGDTDLV
jgi:hypothetical protein